MKNAARPPSGTLTKQERERIQRSKLSVREIAQAMDVSPTTVVKWRSRSSARAVDQQRRASPVVVGKVLALVKKWRSAGMTLGDIVARLAKRGHETSIASVHRALVRDRPERTDATHTRERARNAYDDDDDDGGGEDDEEEKGNRMPGPSW